MEEDEEEFEFTITQPMVGSYQGVLYIQAKDYDEAVEKIKKMTQEDIEEEVQDWEIADITQENGKLEVWDDYGEKQIIYATKN